MSVRPNRADPYDRDLPATPWNRWLRAGYLLVAGLLVLGQLISAVRHRGLVRLDLPLSAAVAVYCLWLAWGVGRLRPGPTGATVANVGAAAHVLAGTWGASALTVHALGLDVGAGFEWLEGGAWAGFFGVLGGPVVGFLFLLSARHATPFFAGTTVGALGLLGLLLAL